MLRTPPHPPSRRSTLTNSPKATSTTPTNTETMATSTRTTTVYVLSSLRLGQLVLYSSARTSRKVLLKSFHPGFLRCSLYRCQSNHIPANVMTEFCESPVSSLGYRVSLCSVCCRQYLQYFFSSRRSLVFPADSYWFGSSDSYIEYTLMSRLPAFHTPPGLQSPIQPQHISLGLSIMAHCPTECQWRLLYSLSHIHYSHTKGNLCTEYEGKARRHQPPCFSPLLGISSEDIYRCNAFT